MYILNILNILNIYNIYIKSPVSMNFLMLLQCLVNGRHKYMVRHKFMSSQEKFVKDFIHFEQSFQNLW